MPEYIYRGDRWTDPALQGMVCDAVRRLKAWSRCAARHGPIGIRGKNGNMLTVRLDGTRVVVLGRQLRRVSQGDVAQGRADRHGANLGSPKTISFVAHVVQARDADGS